NADALAQMRFIHASTKPTDRVMDGFAGFGWFRPHAAFYWFTAPGVRPRVPPQEKARMVAMLADCRTQPGVVILDEHLRQLAPNVEPTVTRFYRPTAYPLLWVRPASTGGCDPQSAGEVSETEIKSHPVR